MQIRNKLKLLKICGALLVLAVVFPYPNNEPKSYFLENTMAEYEKDWPTEVLKAFDEPTFIPKPKRGSEQIRFLMLRSLHHRPVIVRIERSANGSTKVTGKVAPYIGEMMGGELAGAPVEYTHSSESSISDEDYSDFMDAFNSLDICDSGSETTLSGLDGSNWLFEYRNNDVHCQLYIWSPEDKAMQDLAEQFISLAEISKPHVGKIY